jgi:hypothetical protein
LLPVSTLLVSEMIRAVLTSQVGMGPEALGVVAILPLSRGAFFSAAMLCANLIEFDILREGLRRERDIISFMNAHFGFF